jgi:hypothetical protein
MTKVPCEGDLQPMKVIYSLTAGILGGFTFSGSEEAVFSDFEKSDPNGASECVAPESRLRDFWFSHRDHCGQRAP